MFGTAQKTVAAVVTGVIGWGFGVVASDPAPITATEWMFLAVAGATALGVYGVANADKPPADDL